MDKSYESELTPPAAYKEMIDILRSRGLKVGNENRAAEKKNILMEQPSSM